MLPTNLKFTAYSRTNNSSSKDLLLHTSDHPTIDYTAVENSTIHSNDKFNKHYVAVFDPATGKLDVTEAKKMIVRPQVRQFQKEQASEDEDSAPVAKPPSRAALTEAFGTKKSKRAIQSIAENRLLARGGDGDDPLSKALLSTLAGEDDDQPDGSALSRSKKPLPPANLSAKNIEDAYPLSTLIIPRPYQDTLTKTSISYWKSRISESKTIKTNVRFVAHRMDYILKSHLAVPNNSFRLQQVQVLRYIELLVQFHKHIMTLSPQRPIPDPSGWPPKTVATFANVSEQEDLLSRLIAHFFPDRKRSHHALTLLRSTILALTLHIPPPSLDSGIGMLVCEPTDIYLDLAIDQKEAVMLFRELGCKVEYATDAELKRWSLSKMRQKIRGADGKEFMPPRPKFAKLRLPLQFPKLSQGKNISPGKRR